jgi:hypothetical protein
VRLLLFQKSAYQPGSLSFWIGIDPGRLYRGVASSERKEEARFMSAAVITASASILVAVIVFILNQRAQIQQERRQARLATVNSQLRELYGPLNASVEVNERIWLALRQSHLPIQGERRPETATEDWRRWRDNALMPANRKMRDLIVEHADLLIGAVFPQALKDFCAHVASLEIVLASEAGGARIGSLIPHPGDPYVTYVRDSFAQLKTDQQHLTV